MAKIVSLNHLVARIDDQDNALGNITQALRRTAQVFDAHAKGRGLTPAQYREASQRMLDLADTVDTLRWTGQEVKAMMSEE